MTKTITEKVAERIASISPSVNQAVIEHLVGVELEKRSIAIIKGLESLRGLQSEMKKIKPDLGGSFDEDGNETKPTQYSKTAFESRKKITDQIARLTTALDLAIDKGDMSKLNDIK